MFFMPFGPGGCAWWAFVCCVWFLGLVLFWFAWLSGFFGGLGWAWSGFLGCLLTVALAWLHALLCGVGWGLLVLFGEFDPGSGRTLAACLTHASRTERPATLVVGTRVANG